MANSTFIFIFSFLTLRRIQHDNSDVENDDKDNRRRIRNRNLFASAFYWAA